MLVANTLRLTILSQKRTIDIMALVGATRRFIRRPYIIQGILQGGAGGLFASLFIWILATVIALRFQNLLEIPIFVYGIPVILGLIILIVFVPWLLMSRWLKTSMKSELAPEVYRKLCRLASLAGLGPRSPQTPLEFCTEMTLVLPSQAESIENIVQYYIRSAYSHKKELQLMESWNLLKSWREVYPVLLKRLFRIKY